MSLTLTGHESRIGDVRADLLRRIKQKRPEIEDYLRLATSRRRLLMNTTIIAGTLAAALTAAPALGGESFADWLTSIFSLSSPVWQLLCGVASLCAVAAAVATQMIKSYNVEERITCAQGARVKIEALEVGVKSRLITPGEAAIDYIKCIGDIAFIQAPLKESKSPRPTRRRRGPADSPNGPAGIPPPHCTCGRPTSTSAPNAAGQPVRQGRASPQGAYEHVCAECGATFMNRFTDAPYGRWFCSPQCKGGERTTRERRPWLRGPDG